MSDEEGDSESPILFGDDALVAAADLLYQRMTACDKLGPKLENVELAALAPKLRQLLIRTFDGENWPAMNVTASLLEPSFDDFTDVLMDAIDKSQSDGADAVLASLDVLANEMKDDERLARFFAQIKAGAEEGEEAVEEEEEDEENQQDEEQVEEAGDKTEEEMNQENQDNIQAAKDAAGTDINVNSFDELKLDPGIIQAAKDAWRLFISTAESREAAGEAIYAALFEGAPSLQSLFTTPRAVQAMRFMNGLASFVQSLDEPAKLKILVETLGFGHLHLDVTVPRVIIFRDAILDLLKMELAEKFNSSARDGWKSLLNYVGGAIIYVKVHYAERIRCLLKSWKMCNHGDSSKDDRENSDSMAAQDLEQKRMQQAAKEQQKSKGFWGKLKNKGKQGMEHGGSVEDQLKEAKGETVTTLGQNVPTTYPEMFMFNAAVMGFGTSVWMNEVLACFDNIVTNVSNSARLQEECDILALRIARVVKGSVNLGEYKSCMLASLRSLLPKDWDTGHEVAWTWLWENVERLIKRIEGLPPVWERALGTILSSLDEETKYEIRKDIYTNFFNQAPAGQDFFKQSNTYLHIIADKILAMTLELYQNPVKMVDDISALGLRHVGYAIPTELFGPFVTACVEVMMTRTSDETTVESFRWSLGLISKILVRTITEGSTIVMKAVNTNSQKALRKAISCAPRGERAAWMLLVQVGTQNISPLAWAIESGNVEAATAMIRDLLTFRADRDRYYYGVDDLFKRHPDIIKMLCDMAPDVIPKLLDGLIWRSRTTENGMRRVNYYIKHLLLDENSQFSPTLGWVTDTKDPKLVCHPVIVLVSDLVWGRVAYRSFLFGKSWFFFSLLVFIVAQSILANIDANKRGDGDRITVFACRCFIYLCSMTQLLYSHIREFVTAYKTKDTCKILCIPIPKYLKQWEDAASFCLTLSLIVMLSLEPILWCWQYQNGVFAEEHCPEKENLRMPYSVFSMFAMLFYYSLLNLTVVSTRISAFFLVCARMLPEVGLFLGALFVCILTFSSALSVVKHDEDEFAGIQHGAKALLRVSLGTYSADRFGRFRDEPTILVVMFFYCITVVIFFSNILIAQLSCAYSSVYEDMVGYARLERATIVVEIIPSVPQARWKKFVEYLNLNKKLEFNEGDIGVAGGLASREFANLNPTTVDMIRRFGGSTSQEIQWPEEDNAEDGDDRFDHIEKLIQKTLQRVTKTGSSSRKGSAGVATGSMQNTSGTGSSESEGGEDA